MSDTHMADVVLKAIHAKGGEMASFELKALAISQHIDVFLLSKTLQQMIDLGFIQKGSSENGKGRHKLLLTDNGKEAASTSLLTFLQSRDRPIQPSDG